VGKQHTLPVSTVLISIWCVSTVALSPRYLKTTFPHFLKESRIFTILIVIHIIFPSMACAVIADTQKSINPSDYSPSYSQEVDTSIWKVDNCEGSQMQQFASISFGINCPVTESIELILQFDLIRVSDDEIITGVSFGFVAGI